MRLKNWWRGKDSKSKTIAVLSTLVILEMGLCFSTGWTVMPLYEAVFGHSSDPELGLGLMIWQFILWVVTLAMLGVVAIFWSRDLHSNETDEENHDR